VNFDYRLGGGANPGGGPCPPGKPGGGKPPNPGGGAEVIVSFYNFHNKNLCYSPPRPKGGAPGKPPNAGGAPTPAAGPYEAVSGIFENS
jgi:hypothetical protein